MKKFATGLLILVMLLSLACPAFASENFVSSITYKAAPTVTTTVDEDGTEIVGTVTDAQGEAVTSAAVGTILVTPVSEVETSQAIPEAAAQQLQTCYDELTAEGADLAVIIPDLETLLADYQAQQAEQSTTPSEDGESAATTPASSDTTLTVQDLVVRDLFDVTITDEELEQQISAEGNSIDLTFDIGIEPGAFVAVMVYKNEQWTAIKNVVNNGDGTITCTFEHFCPVAILTAPHPIQEEAPAETAPAAQDAQDVENVPAETDSGSGTWLTVGGVALAAIVVLVIILRRKNSKVKTNG